MLAVAMLVVGGTGNEGLFHSRTLPGLGTRADLLLPSSKQHKQLPEGGMQNFERVVQLA